jgi:hypothetical protein
MTGRPIGDVDEYLAALPTRPLATPRHRPPKLYQVSGWPLLKSFNGFSGIERRRGGQLATWLLAAGCIAMPDQCDICASPGPLNLHGENYYDVSRDPALCGRCHRALHLRPYQWSAWEKIVHASAKTGREWFALAPRHGLDLGYHFRAKLGWQAADIEHSPLLPIPDVIAVLLPSNMLPHPYL